MAFSQYSAIQHFDSAGFQVALSSNLDLADNIYTGSLAITKNTIDNSILLAPWGLVTLEPDDGYTGVLVTGASFSVYARPMDEIGAKNSPEASAQFEGNWKANLTVPENKPTDPLSVVISLLGIRKFQLELRNLTGGTLVGTGGNGWKASVLLFTQIPKP